MFYLLNISDKILLEPGELNPKKKVNNSQKNNLVIQQTEEQIIEKENEPTLKHLNYSDIVYKKLRNKYISKILMGMGLVVSIQKFEIKSNLIVEIEGVINVCVKYN